MTSTARWFCAMIAAYFATMAAAQEIGPNVSSDLDGDGNPEQFSLVDIDDDFIVDLHIRAAGKPTLLAKDIAWRGGLGQQPFLSLADNGSLRITSLNESVGRNRWVLTLTVAYRRGAYRVAGYTYDWYDTLNLEDNGTCDLNLLSGTGNLTLNEGPLQLIRSSLKPMPITEWSDDIPLPPECGPPN